MLEEIKSIVREAATLMVADGFEVNMKDGCENIVTSSDLAVQDFLKGRFSGLIPGCGFICEEEDMHDDSREWVWIIDPIDGTANYSRGIDHCCISVALSHYGEVVKAVVFSPWRNEMYTAEKGCGAFLNGRPIHVSGRPFSDGILCCAMSTYRKEYADVCSDIIMEAYHRCNDVRRFGSAAIELCFLASGKCELYFEYRLQPWDYAAGNLILQEAGGTVTDLDGALPGYGGPSLVCGANSAENQAALLSIIRTHILPQRGLREPR